MKRLSHRVQVEANDENYHELLQEIREWAATCAQGYYAFDIRYDFEKRANTRTYGSATHRVVAGIEGYFDRSDDATMFKLAWYKS